jgi:glycosyltransferase involved in cell wall biosynthesis
VAYLTSVVTITDGNLSEFLRTKGSLPAEKNFEWVVVTATPTILPEYSLADYVVTGANKGIFHAMNQGLKHSSGELILFLNSGDQMLKNYPIDLAGKDFLKNDWNWAVGRAIRNSKLNDSWNPQAVRRLRLRFATHSYCHQATFYSKRVLMESGMFLEDSLISDWIKSLELASISPPTLLDFYVCDIDTYGISSRLKRDYRIKEPIRLRNQLGITKKLRPLDYLLQIIFVVGSDIHRKIFK